MSASKKTCLGLIRLCAGLDFFPTDPEIRNLLADTLARRAANDGHAERIITSWLETDRRAPTVSDIVRLASEISVTQKPAARKPNLKCPFCEGQGYQLTLRADGISGASACPSGCLQPIAEELPALPWDYRKEQQRLDAKRATPKKPAPMINAGQLITALQRSQQQGHRLRA